MKTTQNEINEAFLKNIHDKFQSLTVVDDEFVKHIAFEGIVMIKTYQRERRANEMNPKKER